MAKVRFIICDPGGSQTHNFQIRNLMFYSIELQDQFLCSGRESNPHRLSAYLILSQARLPITTPEQLLTMSKNHHLFHHLFYKNNKTNDIKQKNPKLFF
jgi:hypothetical protein